LTTQGDAEMPELIRGQHGVFHIVPREVANAG
jgi:hypothetical protein